MAAIHDADGERLSSFASYAAQASNLTRQLALAGLALAWLLSEAWNSYGHGASGAQLLSAQRTGLRVEFRLPILLFVAVLALDLAQLTITASWLKSPRRSTRRPYAPGGLALGMLWTRVGLLAFAYVLMFVAAWPRGFVAGS